MHPGACYVPHIRHAPDGLPAEASDSIAALCAEFPDGMGDHADTYTMATLQHHGMLALSPLESPLLHTAAILPYRRLQYRVAALIDFGSPWEFYLPDPIMDAGVARVHDEVDPIWDVFFENAMRRNAGDRGAGRGKPEGKAKGEKAKAAAKKVMASLLSWKV